MRFTHHLKETKCSRSYLWVLNKILCYLLSPLFCSFFSYFKSHSSCFLRSSHIRDECFSIIAYFCCAGHWCKWIAQKTPNGRWTLNHNKDDNTCLFMYIGVCNMLVQIATLEKNNDVMTWKIKGIEWGERGVLAAGLAKRSSGALLLCDGSEHWGCDRLRRCCCWSPTIKSITQRQTHPSGWGRRWVNLSRIHCIRWIKEEGFSSEEQRREQTAWITAPLILHERLPHQQILAFYIILIKQSLMLFHVLSEASDFPACRPISLENLTHYRTKRLDKVAAVWVAPECNPLPPPLFPEYPAAH